MHAKIWLALALLLPLGANARLNIVTTTEDIAAIARAVAGDAAQVEGLTPAAANPHFAEAKPSMIRKVARADALLIVGAGMETGWLPPLLENARNAKVQPAAAGFLDLSQHVELRDKPQAPVSRAQGDVHAQGNPHYWLAPANGVRMARAIAAHLAVLDAAHAGDYRARADAFARDIEQRLPQWRAALAALKDKPVIAYHTSFVYLAHAFGFRIVAQVEPKPGIAPSAAHLRALIERIKSERIALLIEEPFYERRSADYLVAQSGIKVAILPQSVGAVPEVKDYPGLFDAIVKRLVATGAYAHKTPAP